MFDVCGIEAANKPVPTCKNHYNVLATSSLEEFQLLSPGSGHGPIHIHMGGVYGGCKEAYANFTERWRDVIYANITDEQIIAAGYQLSEWKWGNVSPAKALLEAEVIGEYYHFYRALWRSHICDNDGTPALLVCPESCDADVPVEDCKCQVDLLVDGETTWQNVFSCIIKDYNISDYHMLMPDEMLEDLTNWISTTPIVEGEMVGSGSTADIVFWITHPVIERLLSAKRLSTVNQMGGVNFTKWSSSDEEWQEYSYYSFEAGEYSWHPEAYRCTGHAADDPVLPKQLPLPENIRGIADLDGDSIISNYEYYLAIDPNNPDGNDYVFDHFQWDHCDGVNVAA
jgi:hypothetical protein